MNDKELHDYRVLSGQTNETPTVDEIVRVFVERNVGPAYHSHLLDDDDNDGQFLRNRINDLIEQARKREDL